MSCSRENADPAFAESDCDDVEEDDVDDDPLAEDYWFLISKMNPNFSTSTQTNNQCEVPSNFQSQYVLPQHFERTK